MRTTEKLGYELLKDPFRNKGTAFTEEERRKYGLVGLLPPRIDDIESQSQRIYRQMERKSSPIEKRRFLMDVFNRNRTLFFRRARQLTHPNLSPHSRQQKYPKCTRWYLPEALPVLWIGAHKGSGFLSGGLGL